MRRGLIVAIICLAEVAVAHAGSERYSSKEMKEAVQPAPCPEWYADNEWNVSVWGTYLFSDNNNTRDFNNFFLRNGALFSVDQGAFFSGDRYLETDHAWGGGVDLKYFFQRYFGLGVEGCGVEVERSGIGDERAFGWSLDEASVEDDSVNE